MLVWNREEASVAGAEEGREGGVRMSWEVGKGQIIQGLIGHSEEDDLYFKGNGSPRGF